MKKNRVSITLVSLTFVFLYTASFLFSSPFGLRKNITQSVPYTYFLSFSSKKVTRNGYVMFDHPLSKLPLAKKVIGLEGDEITIQEGTFCINGKPIGKILPKDTPIEEDIIPPGYIFAYGEHPESYDSRYKGFGLVAIDQVRERLWPIF